jgi:hypothetical protein
LQGTTPGVARAVKVGDAQSRPCASFVGHDSSQKAAICPLAVEFATDGPADSNHSNKQPLGRDAAATVKTSGRRSPCGTKHHHPSARALCGKFGRRASGRVGCRAGRGFFFNAGSALAQRCWEPGRDVGGTRQTDKWARRWLKIHHSKCIPAALLTSSAAHTRGVAAEK